MNIEEIKNDIRQLWEDAKENPIQYAILISVSLLFGLALGLLSVGLGKSPIEGMGICIVVAIAVMCKFLTEG